MSRIVVGVDGSDGSRAALQWAADEARVRGARLEVVYVYDHTPASALYPYPAVYVAEGADAARDHATARAHARALVEQMAGQVDRGLDVEATELQDRRPARALVEQARDADLLVVGSRGRGGFSGLLLGSVSQQCVHHATCPLCIVPTHSPDTRAT